MRSANPARHVSLPFPRAPRYGPEDQAAVRDLLHAGRLSDTSRGPAIAALEDAFADLTNTVYALSFASGTASLHGALRGVGAHPDAGVVTSPLTWISAILVAFHAGSFPVFADVEPGGVNLNPATIATAGQASAVLVTHTFGIPARMDALTAVTGVPIVEDCSHAHGARYASRPVGSWGAAGCFSLMERKPVSGGEGGVLTTNSRTVYERALTLGHHPHRLAAELTDPALRPLTSTGLGYKTRMPTVAAAIASVQLRRLADRMAASETNFARLLDVLHAHAAPITTPLVAAGSTRGWYGTPLIITEPVPNPAALFAACTAAGVPVRPLYEDWLSSPLLQDPALLHEAFPHVRHTGWRPPDPHALPNYQVARRQTLLLKVPDVPAADYMHQVGDTLATVLTQAIR
ncbi:DegT/DnrJ/EryC1/StrS family aminotransferase [Phytohabitans kaempferiae]|uniref:DegT/DnrJ/EryC1/StrS family aminotransferase n=1 Tax=Phytohabitans kaempferiae TaxID=1620943 RepID=A0ABV6MCH8_9ACTN